MPPHHEHLQQHRQAQQAEYEESGEQRETLAACREEA